MGARGNSKLLELGSARSHSVGQELDRTALMRERHSQCQLPREEVDPCADTRIQKAGLRYRYFFYQNTGSRSRHLEDSSCLDVDSRWCMLRWHLLHRGRLRVGWGRV